MIGMKGKVKSTDSDARAAQQTSAEKISVSPVWILNSKQGPFLPSQPPNPHPLPLHHTQPTNTHSHNRQRFIREKAISDASKMYAHLQPLRSSPSGQFADPKNTTTLPSYEDFVTPRPAPAPEPTTSDRRSSTAPRISLTLFSGRRPSASHAGRGLVDGVKAHGRKISETFVGKPLGFSAGGGGGLRKGEGNPYEMRSLMDSSRTAVAGADGKMSGESFSVAGSDEMVVGDRDSAKGGIRKL